MDIHCRGLVFLNSSKHGIRAQVRNDPETLTRRRQDRISRGWHIGFGHEFNIVTGLLEEWN